MRMGLAVFQPVRDGMMVGEDPAVIKLVGHMERALAGEEHLSVQALQAELELLPPTLQRSAGARILEAWLLGELGQHARALVLLEEILIEERRNLAGTHPETAGRWLVSCLAYQGVIYADQGRHGLSRECFEEAQQHLWRLMPEAKPRRLVSVDPDEMDRLAKEDRNGLAPLLVDLLRYFEATGETAGVARVANNLGHLYINQGEPARARYWFERSVELLTSIPSDLYLSYALDSLGLCYQQLGQLELARTAYDEALRRATRMEAPLLQAMVLTGLADVRRDSAEHGPALELYQKAQRLEAQLRNPTGLARIHMERSTLYRRKGQFALAAEEAIEAESQTRDLSSLVVREACRMHTQICSVVLGHSDAARQLASTVDRLAGMKARREEVLGRWYLAVAAHRLGDSPTTALTQLGKALALAVEYRHLYILALELPVSAEVLRLAVEQGGYPEALAGLVQRANSAGLVALLEAVPASAPILAAAGRLGEARALTVHLLGLFRVLRAGQEVDLSVARSQKAVALLKFLLARRGRTVTREQILDTIWPEAEPAAADRSFEVTLSTLRRLLGPPDGPSLILRRGRGYLLNPEILLDVDVDRFHKHRERGNWWWERGQGELAITEWKAAEACYGGEFLAEDPYEDWPIAERERLREQYLDLVLRIAEAALNEGRLGEAIERANQVLSADPIRESAYRLLMRAHAQMGDRAVALRDFRRCTEVLRQELGEEPMHETRELAARIRRGLGRSI